MIIGSELLHPEWDCDSFRLLPQAVSTDGDPQWGVQVPTTDVCCRHCGVLRWAASCFYFGTSRMRAIIINGWHLRVLPSLAFSLLLSLSIFPVFFFSSTLFRHYQRTGHFPGGLAAAGDSSTRMQVWGGFLMQPWLYSWPLPFISSETACLLSENKMHLLSRGPSPLNQAHGKADRGTCLGYWLLKSD